MKRLVFTLIVSTFLCQSFNLNAQDAYSPWTASISTNAINNPVRTQLIDKGRFKTWNWDPASFRIGVARHLTGQLSFETVVSINTVKANFGNVDEKNPYISMDGMFKYGLSNSFVVNPYLTIGGGYTWLDSIGAGTLNGGVGLNIWATYNFGFTIQTVYKHAFEDYGLQHYQHSAGITFKFGGTDSDNDGIVNTEDECPNKFGLVAFKGCPDSDGDGVKDSEDNCPDTFGDLNGCPDKDKDGTPDKFDKCINTPGDKTNKGCPLIDTDKDGIPDKFDKCPEKKGNQANKGCPEVKNTREKLAVNKKSTVKSLARYIFFDENSATINNENKRVLDKISALILNSKNLKFEISGHTDSTFSSEYNLGLSKKRANSVRDYLISKGINPDILIAKGYGEERPIDKTNTDEARRKNRRVEIVPIQ